MKFFFSMQIDSLLKNRTTSMGLAMIFVVLYHLFCADKSITVWKLFYPGYMGVDIFLLLSSYGLCFSINKNSVVNFWKRRYVRILPVFFLMSIFITLINLWSGENVSSWDWFCNMTTLSYYTNLGGQFIDWYLSSLIVLYLLFPLIYKFILHLSDKQTVLVISCSIFFVLAFSTFIDIDWKYECSIGRLPIFLSGIACFKNKTIFEKQISSVFLFCFLLSLFLYMYGYIHTYMVFYMLAPVFLYLTSMFVNVINTKFSRILKFINLIGTNSLEIYAANVVAMACFALLEVYENLSALYFFFTLGFTIVFVLFNRIIKKLL